MVTATREDARRIPLIAVGEERERPAVLVAEIAKATQVDRRVSETLEVLLTCFAHPLQLPAGRKLRLDERVDIAQRTLEADAEPLVPAGVTPLSVLDDTPLGSFPYRRRNRAATEMRRVNPDSATHPACYFSMSAQHWR
jgi:hypothetical protein